MNVLTDTKLLGDVSGTLNGTPTLVQGVHGKALDFDGGRKYVEIGDHGYMVFILKTCHISDH